MFYDINFLMVDTHLNAESIRRDQAASIECAVDDPSWRSGDPTDGPADAIRSLHRQIENNVAEALQY